MMMNLNRRPLTPAPWRVGTSGAIVADSAIGTHPSTDHPADYKYYGGLLLAESIWSPANAHMMAAAPEMYAALDAIAQAHPRGLTPELWMLIQHAMTKAEGPTPVSTEVEPALPGGLCA